MYMLSALGIVNPHLKSSSRLGQFIDSITLADTFMKYPMSMVLQELTVRAAIHALSLATNLGRLTLYYCSVWLRTHRLAPRTYIGAWATLRINIASWVLLRKYQAFVLTVSKQVEWCQITGWVTIRKQLDVNINSSYEVPIVGTPIITGVVSLRFRLAC